MDGSLRDSWEGAETLLIVEVGAVRKSYEKTIKARCERAVGTRAQSCRGEVSAGAAGLVLPGHGIGRGRG